MRVWNTVLIIVIAGFVIFIAVLGSFLLITNTRGGIYFLSLKPGYSWEVKKENITALEQSIKGSKGDNPRVLVILSPKFVVTKNGGGIGSDAPIFYAELKQWKGCVLNVYMDNNIWQRYTPDEEWSRCYSPT